MTRQITIIGNSARTVLASTIIVLPFMIFIQVAQQKSLLAVLPFVLFYTFRMTGVFLIRGVHTQLNSYTLLKLSLTCGILGCLAGGLANLYFPLYLLSGVLLGFSAAWLPMSNTVMTAYAKHHLPKTQSKLILSLALFIITGAVLLLPSPLKFLIFFIIYGLLFLSACFQISEFKDYEVTSHDLEDFSLSYLILFALFFVLIFMLRASRLLADTITFNYFIYGCFILVIAYMVMTYFSNQKNQKKISKSLTVLTGINGAVGNYLFLFCSLYAAGVYGHHALFIKFYLPYVLGIVLAPKLSRHLGGRLSQKAQFGILTGLIIIAFTPFFAIGVLVTSTFKGTLNNWLTSEYDLITRISEDKRIWVKTSLQNIGSILHQFTLMLLGSLIIFNDGFPLGTFFKATSSPKPTPESINLMNTWHIIATGLIILIILIDLIYQARMQSKRPQN